MDNTKLHKSDGTAAPPGQAASVSREQGSRATATLAPPESPLPERRSQLRRNQLRPHQVRPGNGREPLRCLMSLLGLVTLVGALGLLLAGLVVVVVVGGAFLLETLID